MNDSASTTPKNSSGAGAMLGLDATGRISAAGTSANAFWSSADSLVGEHFASLFAFEVASSDPEILEMQWDALLAAAAEGSVDLSAQPRNGAEPFDVTVRLEKNLGGTSGYLALVQPPAAAAPRASASASAGTSGDDSGFTSALQVLAEKSSVGFFDLNFKAGRIQFSPAWKKLLGYQPTELPDTIESWHKLIHPDDSGAAPDKPAKKPVPGARSFALEYRMQHQRGHWVWIQCVGVQVTGPDGALERVSGLHLDISERKQVEEESVINDARIQDLTGGGPLAAFELDFVNNVFWFSPAWEQLLGYEEGELAPEAASFAAALPAAEATAGVEAWLLARAPGQTGFVEPVKLRAKDGRAVPVLFGAHRTVTRKREVTRVVGFAVPLPADASVGDGALPALLVNEAFGALAESVVVTDPRGKVLFINAPAARMLRMTVDTARGQSIGDYFRLVNRQSHRVSDDPIDRALSADKPLPLISDDALAGPEGTVPLPIVWTARAAFGPDNKAKGVVLVFRNPEEMTLTPEELVKANRFEGLGLLAGGIAHDFNNLLTTILGAVSLAKDNRDYSALGDAEKSCDTAKGLTKQLLAFAKGGSGTQAVVPSKQILEDAIRIAAAASTAEITLEVPEGTDPVHVDPAQILQVFQNLIVNALQAMPPAPHKPRLQISAGNVVLADNQVPSLPAGPYVEFEVRDNGSGIKPEHVEKIFDPFFTTKKHGTGLGLATVLSIVRKHAGQIGLDTQVGVGTAFTVYIPKAEKPVEVQARRAPSLRFGTGRILFMDDDAKISALTATMLTSLNYKFDMAKNGDEAITFYKRYMNIGRPYDVVIMDITVVGGMGGDECFEHLRKMDPEVRAIVSSGYDNDEMKTQYLNNGWCGYLTKPYRVTDLGKVLKQVLG